MNVLELAQKYVQLKKVATTKGGEWQGPCPGCGGTDRFHVWPDANNGEGKYWCRPALRGHCGKSGDGIQFLRDFEGLSFHEACARLGKDVAQKPDLQAPREKPAERFVPEVKQGPPMLWQEKAWKFVTWAFEQVFELPEVIEYLARRGITEEIIVRYGLGWNGGQNGKDVFRSRESWGLSKLANDKGRPKPLWLPMGLVIPYMRGNEVRRIRIRRPDPLDFGSRYYVVPGSDMSSLVVERDARVFVITEAELDAYMVAGQLKGIAGAVGMGSASTKPDKETLALLDECVHILVALDADGAGYKAAAWWKDRYPDCDIWPVPKGKDPGEAFEAGVDIREWIMAGLPPGLRL